MPTLSESHAPTAAPPAPADAHTAPPTRATPGATAVGAAARCAEEISAPTKAPEARLNAKAAAESSTPPAA